MVGRLVFILVLCFPDDAVKQLLVRLRISTHLPNTEHRSWSRVASFCTVPTHATTRRHFFMGNTLRLACYFRSLLELDRWNRDQSYALCCIDFSSPASGYGGAFAKRLCNVFLLRLCSISLVPFATLHSCVYQMHYDIYFRSIVVQDLSMDSRLNHLAILSK